MKIVGPNLDTEVPCDWQLSTGLLSGYKLSISVLAVEPANGYLQLGYDHQSKNRAEWGTNQIDLELGRIFKKCAFSGPPKLDDNFGFVMWEFDILE